MTLSDPQWRSNFRSFIWHATFLALTTSFMDVDTIIPSMMIKAGGTSLHLGLLTAIMTGGASLSQLVFGGFLSGKQRKKIYLLLAIHLRVISLLFLSMLFFYSPNLSGDAIIASIFLLISLFSFSGAFANVSYMDILGKSVLPAARKRFFSIKQVVNSVGIMASTLVVRELLKIYDYPSNYGVLFLIAGLMLWVATGGFWKISEALIPQQKKLGLMGYLSRIPGEIRSNSNLRNYLLIINTMGLGLGVLPFAILLAKTRYGLGYGMIGNFLLFRTIGMLAAGLILYRLSSKIHYPTLLKFCLVVGAMVPVLCLVITDNQTLYQLVFALAGVYVACFKMATNGVLLEISTNENRALYTGISGAGSILTAVFPLLAGALIPLVGFSVVFLAVAMLMFSSFIFVLKLKCKPRS
jgi:MFS family permease